MDISSLTRKANNKNDANNILRIQFAIFLIEFSGEFVTAISEDLIKI